MDDDSVDWMISETGDSGALRSSKLELQLKCTATPDFSDGMLRYRLSTKNYDELIPRFDVEALRNMFRRILSGAAP